MRPIYPPLEPGVFRLTQSDTETYLKCGIAYNLRREAKGRYATVRMMIGSGVAAGARDDNVARIAGSCLPLPEIIERSVTAYEREAEASDVRDTKLEVAEGKDSTADAARTYALGVAPKMDGVLAAEEPVIARFEGVEGLELAGTPDVVTKDGIGDLKVGRPWDDGDADKSRQLTAYGLLHRAKLGAYPRRQWIDNVARHRGNWIARRIYTYRDESDYAAYLETMKRVRAGIEAGVFLPAPEKAWYCSTNWCPFWGRECPVTQP